MRRFLKELNLDPKTINAIMNEYGKYRTDSISKDRDYRNKIAEYEKQIQQLNDAIQEKDKSLENLQNLTKENTDLKNEIAMNGSNVKKEFSKFVRSEIEANVNEENDFATVLESYKNENPQYFGETQVKKVQSSPALTGVSNQPQTTNDIMNNILRSTQE